MVLAIPAVAGLAPVRADEAPPRASPAPPRESPAPPQGTPAPASDGRGSLWLFGSGVLVLGLGVLVARRVGGTPPGPAAA